MREQEGGETARERQRVCRKERRIRKDRLCGGRQVYQAEPSVLDGS